METPNYKMRIADEKIEKYLRLFGQLLLKDQSIVVKHGLEENMQKVNLYFI